MGFGDPYHEHPLRFYELPEKGAQCSRCKLPITSKSYGCTRCDHFVHKLCAEMPQTMWHPLHAQHPLIFAAPISSTSSDPTSNTTSCNKCFKPSLGYAYHCPICQFNLHLTCFLTLNFQNHQHPLNLFNLQGFNPGGYKCSICGFNVVGFTFACKSCEYYLHHECTLLPPTVKHHHLHELTFNYGFPVESIQVYCDVCEDRDGKELDRTASYYYCKSCDYIAHVHCVVDLKQKEIDHFIHEQHPLSFSEKPPVCHRFSKCKVCEVFITDINYHCNKCNWIAHESCIKIPPSVRHPVHEQHDLIYSALDPAQPVTCSLCCGPVHGPNYQCTACKCSVHVSCILFAQHPSHNKHNLIFEIESHYRIGDVDGFFRCNACGDLGNGFNMHCTAHGCNFDLHLECSLLPTSTQYESHQHPLFLAFPILDHHSLSLPLCCSVCGEECDPKLWNHYCKECDYVAHLRCVASDLLLALRASDPTLPNLCNILPCKEISVVDNFEPWLRPNILIRQEEISLVENLEPRSLCSDLVGEIYRLQPPLFGTLDDGYRQMGMPSSSGLLRKLSNDEETSIASIHGTLEKFQYSSHDHPLTILDQLFKKGNCCVCKKRVFRPAYCCTECDFYLHKSCAELPQKFTSHSQHIFELAAPSYENGLSICSGCNRRLRGYAYHCTTCAQVALDVHCAFGAPFIKHKLHEHFLIYKHRDHDPCEACGSFEVPCFRCPQVSCSFKLHIECAMLPYSIEHRIHRHPLELAGDLDASHDEYICDVCEKELNPKLWAYRCSDECKGYATSHVSCVITSKARCHFEYELECQGRRQKQAEK